MELWPHQKSGIESLRASLRNHKHIVGVSPTASGKTFLGGWMSREALSRGHRVLWIAHTKELVSQPVEQFIKLGMNPGIIQAGVRPTPDALIQAGTIQSIVRRELPSADLVFIDECHLFVETTSARRIFDAYPKAWIIGLSASPWRLDGRSFSPQYTDLVTIATPEELIDQGILIQPTYYGPDQPDLSDVNTVGGDYEKNGLELACNKPDLIGSVATSYLTYARGRQAILFAVSRNHSRECAEALCAVGVRAVHLDGETPDKERDRIISEFKAGLIDVVCNVEVLTTGFDHKDVSCVIVARPTKSVALWMQMVGRCMRSAPGKRSAIVLDHAGNTYGRPDSLGYAHVSRAWSLVREKKKSKQAMVPLTMCKGCFAVFPAGINACPECGHVRPAAEMKVVIGEGSLVKITKAFTPDQKLTKFHDLCAEAIRFKMSRDYVKRCFHKTFGHWPRGMKWPDALPVDIELERGKLQRVAESKGLGSWWVEKKLKEMR